MIAPVVLVLSAHTAVDLRRLADALARTHRRELGLASLCAAAAELARGPHRATIVAASDEELVARLAAFAAGQVGDGVTSSVAPAAPPTIAFVFGGQGPEWWAMGRELFATEPSFAAAIRSCEAALRALVPHASIERELAVPEAESRIADVEVLQPMLFALQVAIVAMLREYGITPDAVIGHSFGEVSAAYVAGALSLDDAMRIHVERSRLMKRLAGAGRMAVVETAPERARRAVAPWEGRLAVGVVNSPVQTVLTGDDDALASALAELARDGIAYRAIPMPYPVHAPAMRAIGPELVAMLARLAPRLPQIPLFSTVTGGESDVCDARHWRRNIDEPALFAPAIDAMLASGVRVFVEIGPHPVLAAPIGQCAASRGIETAVLPTLRRQKPERAAMFATLGALATRGRSIRMNAAATDAARAHLAAAIAAAPSGDVVTLRDRLRGDAPASRRVRLVRRVIDFVCEHSGRPGDDIGPDTSLRDAGLDSAGAVALAVALGAELGCELPPTLAFERPTAGAVADHVLVELGLSAAAAPRIYTARANDEPIAIVGIGCRFPGGRGPDAFFASLLAGADQVVEIPPSRWDAAATFDPDPDAAGKTYSKWAAFVDDVDRFDARFFGIAPREAAGMDPQQRLLLETSWEALEHAGIAPRGIAGSRTGVFVGLCTGDYGGRTLYAADAATVDAYTFTGTSPSVAAGRLSYVLALEGPALVVDTACSSSLVALHLACRSLRDGESELALAGGVNLILSPTLMIYFSRLRAMSPTGRSRAFDAGADGYVRGEGCGMLVLRRLSDAKARRERVIAIVRATAVNQDGRSNGLTAPNGLAQQAVVRDALHAANLAPARVGYVEAHGTGTPLGDPIELAALGAVLGEGRAADRPVVVGSVKTNIGHTEGAAGVAGVIKAALSLERAQIPRSLHFRDPNPRIAWSTLPVRVAETTLPWPREREPRIAGVSSFGFSGTNAHIVLEEAPVADARGCDDRVVPIVISARTPHGLRTQADRLRAYLAANPNVPLVDVAYTLAAGRSHLELRAAAVAARATVDAALARIEPQRAAVGGVAFLFSGQGSQLLRMGRGLAERFPVFRDAFESAAALLDRDRSIPLAAVLDGRDAALLDLTEHAQPALFALQVALARLYESVGVRADAVAGHSVGEIAAAHVAGVLSLADSCALVASRARLMQALPAGGVMLAIDATEDEVRPLVAARARELDVAAVNGARRVVVSGDAAACNDLAAHFKQLGRGTKRVAVSHAFHSPHIDAMLDELRRVAASLTYAPATTPIVSTATGRLADARELACADYWVRQARERVRFADAIDALLALRIATFVELGPQATLSALGAVHADGASFLPSLQRGNDDVAAFSTALAELHARGAAIDWDAFFAPLDPRRVPLPTYPFERDRHWIDERPPVVRRRFDTEAELADSGEWVFGTRLGIAERPWLADHVVSGAAILPGTGFLELALEAAARIGARVDELALLAPLALPSTGAVEVQLRIGAAGDADRRSLTVHARHDRGWRLHATGALGPADEPAAGLATWPPDGAVEIDVAPLYSQLAAAGLAYGDAFRLVTRAWTHAGSWFVETATDAADEVGRLATLLDAALHPFVRELVERTGRIALPFSWQRATRWRACPSRLRVRIVPGDTAALLATDERGAPVLAIEALAIRPAAVSIAPAYRVAWRELELAASSPAPHAFHDHSAGPREATRAAVEHLQRALGEPDAAIVLATRGAVAIDGEPVVAIEHAGFAALARAARAEYPDRAIVHVDADDDPRSLARVGAALASAEPTVALRRGRAFVPHLVAVPASTPKPITGPVLITGGTGGVGALIARHLVARHGVHELVLVSRRAAEAYGLRAELEAAGASVELVACDVGDRVAVERLLAGRVLRGLVHAAGVVDDATLAAVTAEQIDRVFASKVDAALHLDAATRGRSLDFFVVLSSVAAVVGPAGQGVYAAANAVLDAIARRRRAAGEHATSIAYGPWRDAGMASRLAANDERRLGERYGMVPLATDAALAGFDAGIACDDANLVVVALDASRMSRDAEPPAIWRDRLARPVPPRPAVATFAAEIAALPAGERGPVVLAWVRGEAARCLRLASASDVPIDTSLRDVGMDSLVAVELRTALARRLGIALPATLVFDHPTSRALAATILERIAPAPAPPSGVDAMSEAELDTLLATLQSGEP